MTKKELLDNILGVLHQAKEDKEKLEHIYNFLMEEIYEDDEAKIEIPEKHKKMINGIAQSIDAGLVCYINTETMEIVEIFKELLDSYDYVFEDDNDEYELDDEEKLLKQDFNKIGAWDNKIEIEPLYSNESYKIMESFIANIIPTGNFQDILYNAINKQKPFANFRGVIDDSDYLQDWYDYKQNYLEEHVWLMFQQEGVK